ncbi:MAG: hypothetical protein ACXVA9_13520, partial [Bdellovibrionales bacterium]
IVQDPTAAGDSLELDLIKIWNANRPVYYSPELKTVIGGGQILQIKPENGPYEVSTEKLLKVRSVNLKVAEAFEAAELELQNMKFVYTSNWQRQFEVREYETAVRAMRGNRLLPRRLLSQNMALNGKVVSPTERENLATQAMKNYRFAISTLQTELNRTTSAPSTFDCMGALIGKKGQPSVK